MSRSHAVYDDDIILFQMATSVTMACTVALGSISDRFNFEYELFMYGNALVCDWVIGVVVWHILILIFDTGFHHNMKF